MAEPKPEPLVMAAQLTWLFKAQGVNIHYRYARAIISECPQAVRRRYIRFSDAWTWWNLNREFHPFAKKAKNPQQLALTSTGSH